MNPGAKDLNERTAFHFACIRGDTNIVKMLLKSAVDFKLDLQLETIIAILDFNLL